MVHSIRRMRNLLDCGNLRDPLPSHSFGSKGKNSLNFFPAEPQCFALLDWLIRPYGQPKPAS